MTHAAGAPIALFSLGPFLVTVVALGLVIVLSFLFCRGLERLAQRALDRAYTGFEIKSAAAPKDVMVVYDTYHGFLVWHVHTEHRVILPLDDARDLLGRLLRFNLAWGLVAEWGVLVAPLAIYNYVVQRQSIARQEAGAAFAAIGSNASDLVGPGDGRRRRSWFLVVFGSIAALLAVLFGIVAIYALAIRQFDAGFGGVALALLLGWIARDWLGRRVG
jgi:hypothetical protein